MTKLGLDRLDMAISLTVGLALRRVPGVGQGDHEVTVAVSMRRSRITQGNEMRPR